MRASIESAEWSAEREKQYRTDCEGVAGRAGVELVVRDSTVYLSDGQSEDLLVTASKPKRLWYEAWLALVDRFPALAKP